MNLRIALATFLISVPSFAGALQSTAVQDSGFSSPSFSRLRLGLILGSAFSGKTDGQLAGVDTAGSYMVTNASNSAGAAPAMSAELSYVWIPQFQTALAADYTVYSYNIPGAVGDRSLSLSFVPKAVLPIERFQLWAGAGLGLFLSNITRGSEVAQYSHWGLENDPFQPRFVLSPRVGFDYQLTSRFSAGLQLVYFTLNYQRTDAANDFSENMNRSWFTTGFRLTANLF